MFFDRTPTRQTGIDAAVGSSFFASATMYRGQAELQNDRQELPDE